MKYEIDTNENDISIEVSGISGIRGRQEELLELFQKCQEGRCTCSTQEYSKLDSLVIENDEDTIRLKLKSKSNEKFDKSEISKCLEYAKGKVLNEN